MDFFDFPDIPEVQIGLVCAERSALRHLYQTKLGQFRQELEKAGLRSTPQLGVVWQIDPDIQASAPVLPWDRDIRVGVFTSSGLREFRLPGHTARNWRQLRREVVAHLKQEGILD